MSNDATPTADDRLALIRELYPSLQVHTTSTKSEGQSNDVVIVNGEWVFRFARSEAARRDLEREAKVLSVLPNYVDLKAPEWDSPRPGVMRQRKLVGQSLDRATLLRQPPDVQERLVESLAHFLFQLHRVPPDKLAGVGKSGAGEQAADAVTLFRDCERELFPHLKDYAIEVIREHFDPVLDGRLTLDFTPVLIHADLNPSHVLWSSEHGTLAAVIDFGMAGFGDAAYDYASMILAYGETALRRMHSHHQSIGEKIDRARFWAFAIELRLVLAGLRSGDVRWFCADLGFARDALPIGTPWRGM